MKKYIYSLIVLGIIISSCSNMNDIHQEFLEDGERVYIGKVDSINVLPGNERFMLHFWISDPRAKSVTFYWVPEDDSVHYELANKLEDGRYELLIESTDNSDIIKEGKYTLQAVTSDSKGNRSLIKEKMVNVYGDRYRTGILNRGVVNTKYNSAESTLEIEFTKPLNDNDTGVEVVYTDVDGKTQSEIFTDLNDNTTIIIAIDNSKEITYRTLFKPEPNAIDIFYTEFSVVK